MALYSLYANCEYVLNEQSKNFEQIQLFQQEKNSKCFISRDKHDKLVKKLEKRLQDEKITIKQLEEKIESFRRCQSFSGRMVSTAGSSLSQQQRRKSSVCSTAANNGGSSATGARHLRRESSVSSCTSVSRGGIAAGQQHQTQTTTGQDLPMNSLAPKEKQVDPLQLVHSDSPGISVAVMHAEGSDPGGYEPEQVLQLPADPNFHGVFASTTATGAPAAATFNQVGGRDGEAAEQADRELLLAELEHLRKEVKETKHRKYNAEQQLREQKIQNEQLTIELTTANESLKAKIESHSVITKRLREENFKLKTKLENGGKGNPNLLALVEGVGGGTGSGQGQAHQHLGPPNNSTNDHFLFQRVMNKSFSSASLPSPGTGKQGTTGAGIFTSFAGGTNGNGSKIPKPAGSSATGPMNNGRTFSEQIQHLQQQQQELDALRWNHEHDYDGTLLDNQGGVVVERHSSTTSNGHQNNTTAASAAYSKTSRGHGLVTKRISPRHVYHAKNDDEKTSGAVAKTHRNHQQNDAARSSTHLQQHDKPGSLHQNDETESEMQRNSITPCPRPRLTPPEPSYLEEEMQVEGDANAHEQNERNYGEENINNLMTLRSPEQEGDEFSEHQIVSPPAAPRGAATGVDKRGVVAADIYGYGGQQMKHQSMPAVRAPEVQKREVLAEAQSYKHGSSCQSKGPPIINRSEAATYDQGTSRTENYGNFKTVQHNGISFHVNVNKSPSYSGSAAAGGTTMGEKQKKKDSVTVNHTYLYEKQKQHLQNQSGSCNHANYPVPAGGATATTTRSLLSPTTTQAQHLKNLGAMMQLGTARNNNISGSPGAVVLATHSPDAGDTVASASGFNTSVGYYNSHHKQAQLSPTIALQKQQLVYSPSRQKLLQHNQEVRMAFARNNLSPRVEREGNSNHARQQQQKQAVENYDTTGKNRKEDEQGTAAEQGREERGPAETTSQVHFVERQSSGSATTRVLSPSTTNSNQLQKSHFAVSTGSPYVLQPHQQQQLHLQHHNLLQNPSPTMMVTATPSLIMPQVNTAAGFSPHLLHQQVATGPPGGKQQASASGTSNTNSNATGSSAAPGLKTTMSPFLFFQQAIGRS
ncbi:unnamed protein product [Amoebophrya sp. A120]|nr:unnamed protein product [Amoebophrya sp. A120]|eukprot:GSA120T00025617001.1